MTHCQTTRLCLFLLCSGMWIQQAVCDEEVPISFSGDIRPILSDKCFACHGPDEKHRQGGLRLDLRASAFGQADSEEPIIVADHPEQSLLISRITATDDSVLMPPAETNKPLTPEEVDLLQRWVAAGAPWEEHWSFIPPQRPPVPEVSNAQGMHNAIDAFIRRKLAGRNLPTSAPADKTTLIRRVTLDLTGLPPTPEEVQAFLDDTSSAAYETLVDRLLNSPRYGEQMAHFWLDAARYGDTHGLHLDNYREMWPYRDWVISAFNRNLPYDQFITEQLAGDLLEDPTPDQIIASGFNRCHVTTSEGGSISEEVYTRNVVDRVVTTGTVMMGLTFDCTRCHDHKFDPLTMRDFYGLFAYFNSLDQNPLDGNKEDPPPIVQVPTPEQAAQLASYDQQLQDLKMRMNGDWPELDDAQQQWLTETKQQLEMKGDTNSLEWTVLAPTTFTSSGQATLTLQEDGSLLASDANPAKEVYEIIAPLTGSNYRTVQLEGLTHPSLTNKGAGRSSNSNVVLTEFEVYVASKDEPENWQQVKLTRGWADHEQTNGDFKIANAIDGKPQTGWATEGFKKLEDRKAWFLAEQPFGSEGGQIRIVQRYESVYSQHQFGRVRLSLTTIDPLPTSIPKEIEELVRMDSEMWNDDQRNKLRDHFRNEITTDAEYVTLRNELADVQKKRDAFNKQIPTTLVSLEMSTPKPAYILTRGEYDQRGEEVSRATPTMLPPMQPDWPNNRLGLAHWLTDQSHPLTARVAVNRFWQQLFGVGLVKTSEDFGSQGQPPSHPALLDWLAVEFQETGWDIKRLMKLMVMSATYQQSSVVTPAQLAIDPENRLLSRGPRFRLDAEMLRDQALSISGMLVEQTGGPAVKPPQPGGLWEAVGYTGSNTARFTPDTALEKIHRRTIYTFYKRTAPPPQVTTFDGPSREACTVRRERTNTPLQALLLFNDPQYVEAARGLAQRTLSEAEQDADRMRLMFQRCTGRQPSDNELAELLAGLQADRAAYQADEKAATELLSVGSYPLPEKYNAADLAAWTMTANLLLNLDEVVTKN